MLRPPEPRGTLTRSPRAPVPHDGLTLREADVPTEIGRGRSNTEIAASLIVSQATVTTHEPPAGEDELPGPPRLVVNANRTGRAAIS